MIYFCISVYTDFKNEVIMVSHIVSQIKYVKESGSTEKSFKNIQPKVLISNEVGASKILIYITIWDFRSVSNSQRDKHYTHRKRKWMNING